jgi:hypothetical protein
VGYVVSLRESLDAAGFGNTEIIGCDGAGQEGVVVSMAESNATYNASIGGVGSHYPCDHPIPSVQEVLHKKFWASEDFSTVADWAGGGCWGRLLNQNYVRTVWIVQSGVIMHTLTIHVFCVFS